jgi:hypothetical protein
VLQVALINTPAQSHLELRGKFQQRGTVGRGGRKQRCLLLQPLGGGAREVAHTSQLVLRAGAWAMMVVVVLIRDRARIIRGTRRVGFQ